MTLLARSGSTQRGRGAGWRRWVRRTAFLNLGLLFLAALLAGGFYLRLAIAPYSLTDYSGRVAKALAHRLGPGWRVQIQDTALELNGILPAVRTAGLEIRNAAGLLVVSAPYGLVSLDPLGLLVGSFTPREIELRDLRLRGAIGRDGSVTFAPEQRPLDAVPAPAVPAGGDRSPVAAALASLLDPVVRETSVIGALDRATIVDASLTLLGPDGVERAAFGDVDARFERIAGGDRRIDVSLTGQHGNWTIQGRVGDGPDRRAALGLEGVPIADALLLAGLPALPGGSDLKLSAQLSADFAGGQLTRLGGRFGSSAGQIARPGRSALVLDRAEGRAEWDETARTLRLSDVEIESEGTSLRVEGDMEAAPDAGWTLRLAARDVAVAALSPADRPFRLERASAELSFREGIVVLDAASVTGPGVDLRASGSAEWRPEGPVLRGLLEGGASDTRRLIRLWPDSINPDLRGYLAEHVLSGTMRRFRIAMDLAGPDAEAAFGETPFTDKALAFDFSVSDLAISPIDGMPPLSALSVDGQATGTQVSLSAGSGRIETGEGRSLAFSEGSFRQTEISRRDSLARIGFRIDGGLDALASLLRSPAMRGAGTVDLDPAAIRGRAELKVRLRLNPRQVPAAVADLPLSITGRLADVGMDKLAGRERLESGAFLVSYESGAFGLKGDAKLGGVPATIDVSGIRGGTTEVAVALTLDDAARARRSLPAAPQLAGPVPVKLAASFSGTTRTAARVEADLTRAAIDGLVPGWTKPAGKPGRLAFSLGEGDPPEIRDLSVEAGSVQIRGGLSFSAAGALEKADLSTFRLSPGDDMRVQLERGQGSVLRLTVRGNNGDARPVLRWLSAPQAKGGASRDTGDLDLDLALTILSGHNDEAMTGAAGRLSVRGGDLRSFQFAGRFRQALVEGQLARRDSAAPVLTVQAGDAGAALRFLDVYRRMIGGRLAIEARAGDGVQEGRFTIDEFGLKNEPALRRIASQSAAAPQGSSGSDERGAAPVARSDLDQVLFNRLTGDFRRAGGRIDFRDVAIYGAQVGFTLAGTMDIPRDRLDVSGTFVPAYMLNNAFGQLPVVGLLLGGGRNEGLFAVDFRAVGPISSPTLTVNPLTAVAPGILRKLFGWMLEGGAAPPGSPSRGADR